MGREFCVVASTMTPVQGRFTDIPTADELDLPCVRRMHGTASTSELQSTNLSLVPRRTHRD